jgi:signal peptidase
MRRGRAFLRSLPVTFVIWIAFGLLAGLVLAPTLPLALGMRSLVVLSGSMEPTLHVGDVTVVQRISPAQARVGEVITFRAPETGRLTTHRVRAVRVRDGRYAFVTKGDANNAVERWTVPPDAQLSRAVFRIPMIGRAIRLTHTPLGWALLVGLPLLGLCAYELRRIWRPRPEGGYVAPA